jgi:hypothetical protein
MKNLILSLLVAVGIFLLIGNAGAQTYVNLVANPPTNTINYIVPQNNLATVTYLSQSTIGNSYPNAYINFIVGKITNKVYQLSNSWSSSSVQTYPTIAGPATIQLNNGPSICTIEIMPVKKTDTINN